MCGKETTAPFGVDFFSSVDTVCTSLLKIQWLWKSALWFPPTHNIIPQFLLLCTSNVLLCIRKLFMKYFSQIKLRVLLEVHLPAPAHERLTLCQKLPRFRYITPAWLVTPALFPAHRAEVFLQLRHSSVIKGSGQQCKTVVQLVTQLYLHRYRASAVALTCIQKYTCSHQQRQWAFCFYALMSSHVLTE